MTRAHCQNRRPFGPTLESRLGSTLEPDSELAFGSSFGRAELGSESAFVSPARSSLLPSPFCRAAFSADLSTTRALSTFTIPVTCESELEQCSEYPLLNTYNLLLTIGYSLLLAYYTPMRDAEPGRITNGRVAMVVLAVSGFSGAASARGDGEAQTGVVAAAAGVGVGGWWRRRKCKWRWQ